MPLQLLTPLPPPMPTPRPPPQGIWGPKGQGKTFQLELALKLMGVEAIVMSAGELESEVAGFPGRLIRERYGRAAAVCKTEGKLAVLVINDLDAGLGRFQNTQCTVNNQIVVATLMALCDSPAFVSMGEDWIDATTRSGKRQNRVPIIVTGNDFSTLFAPLVRDGRMDKLYWEPTRDELVGIVWAMFKDDEGGCTKDDIGTLVDSFPGQSLDFFGSVRQACHDGAVRAWVLDACWDETANKPDLERLHALLLDVKPERSFGDWRTESEILAEAREMEEKRRARFVGVKDLLPALTLDVLMVEARRLAAEQDAMNEVRLAGEYLKMSGLPGASLVGLQG